MAFTKHIWIPRDVQYPGRRILTPTGNTNEYDITRSEGTVNAEGDILSAELLNSLEDRIAAEFLNKLDTSTISSGEWSPTLYGETTAGSPTYGSATYGKWNAIGDFVLLRGYIVITSKGGISGNIDIGGLPHISDSKGSADVKFVALNATVAADGFTPPSANYIRMHKAGFAARFTDSELFDDSNLTFSACYIKA